jgi:hypothetical protein
LKNWFLVSAFSFLAAAEIVLGPVMVTWDGAGPDLLLLLAVFVALRAPWSMHPFFYLGLGSFSDLALVPRPGLRGFTYLVVALTVERLSPGRHRRHPLVLAIVCAAGALLVETVYLLAGARDWPAGLRAGLSVAVRSALMTGAAGLLLGVPANLMARLFGWPPSGARLSWKQLMAVAAAGTSRAPRRPGK